MQVGLEDCHTSYNIYLNGNLMDGVLSANEETGVVVIWEYDWRELRDTGRRIVLPSDDPENSQDGYATLTCRGEVRIEPLATPQTLSEGLKLITEIQNSNLQLERHYRLIGAMDLIAANMGVKVPNFWIPQLGPEGSSRTYFIQQAVRTGPNWLVISLWADSSAPVGMADYLTITIKNPIAKIEEGTAWDAVFNSLHNLANGGANLLLTANPDAEPGFERVCEWLQTISFT
jgi:hypothetical protein